MTIPGGQYYDYATDTTIVDSSGQIYLVAKTCNPTPSANTQTVAIPSSTVTPKENVRVCR